MLEELAQIVFALYNEVGRRQSGRYGLRVRSSTKFNRSRCTPRSRMLAEVVTLRPQMSMTRGRGCGVRWFGVVKRIVSVFASFKSR